MNSSFVPPRQVKIGDAAAFVGTTPRTIRHYQELGLFPEPERGGDHHRRYGYDEMIRLLWIRKMADAGIALSDIRDAASDTDSTDRDVMSILERLEETLAAQEAELQRQRTAVRRMRTQGLKMGLLSDLVTNRLDGLPAGSVRQEDLDNLLVTERIFGSLGAAIHTTRVVALSAHPALRAESDRVGAAEEALDDTVAVDDPRVAQVAMDRFAFEVTLNATIERSGLADHDEAFFDSWEASHGAEVGEVVGVTARDQGAVSAFLLAGKMPYDFSPARLRCIELAEEMAAGGTGYDDQT